MRLLRLLRTAGVFLTLASFPVACSAPSINPPALSAANIYSSKKSASAYFVITVPKKSTSGLRAHYVSPATKSISMVVSTLSGKVILTKDADLTAKSPGCTKVSVGTRCTINGISLAAGSYRADVTGYSQTKERGTVLSIAQSIPFTLKGGPPKKIAFTMDGVPTSFNVVPSSDAVTGSPAKGFTIGAGGVWGDPQTFLLSPLDADGDTIVGVGAPHLSVTSSNPAFTVFSPVGLQQSFSIIPPLNAKSASTVLTLIASYSNKNICAQRNARCSQTVNLAYAPFAADDWITFAHDFRRTGEETQTTGITASTVNSLIKRWSVTLPAAVYSSPVVYNGNVIVVTYSGVVYDLSAVDGSIIWQRTISSTALENTKSTPMIDTADGLVFMGTWYSSTGNIGDPEPSHFFALHLSDGSIAWQTVLPGYIHDAPVYANGVVYEGWSGGDPPQCINGGISAFNAKTGAVNWTWLVNPVNNPGGGGGVWGAIAWDGSHLIFGTGNTCQGEEWDQGAVALNPDGSMAWHFQADPTNTDDNDTGGGVSIVNNTATFENKNGSLYSLDAANGHQIVSVPLGDPGGHATPTTDGSTFVVGTGFSPASSAAKRPSPATYFSPAMYQRGPHKTGLISHLKAITASGTALWSIPMIHAVTSYAAINNGIVYEGMDNMVDAISLQSGTILTQFSGLNYFNAGPVVVPSGLYLADYTGAVYAYSLPHAGGAFKRVKR